MNRQENKWLYLFLFSSKSWFPYSLCGSLRVVEGRTVSGKTEKDRERPNGNTTERSVNTLSDPQKAESLRITEIETSSVSATLKDPQRKQKKRLSATMKDPQRS